MGTQYRDPLTGKDIRAEVLSLSSLQLIVDDMRALHLHLRHIREMFPQTVLLDEKIAKLDINSKLLGKLATADRVTIK